MYRSYKQGTFELSLKAVASQGGWRLSLCRYVAVLRYTVIPRTMPWLLFFSLFATGFYIHKASAQETQETSQAVFATVNGVPIRLSTYQTLLKLSARQHFYHGHPPEEELRAFRKEVGNRLIDESVLHQEALRRGIEPDAVRVTAELEKNVRRLSAQQGWEQAKDHLLPILREGIERNDRISQLENQFRMESPPPSETQLQAYYESHIDKFTSPPQSRIAMILLKVPPWADTQAWSERRQALESVRLEISKGMEFSDAAKRYSDDSSANSGGDMGYLHQGMLGAQAEEAIASLELNEISEPVTLLEGVALFRLIETTGKRINPLEKVRHRAVDLLMREQRETAVNEAKRRLRNSADIRYADPEYYELRQEVTGRSETNNT